MAGLLGLSRDDSPVREAAWIARCIGRADTVPLGEADLEALASFMDTREISAGGPLFHAGEASTGVWIIRRGLVELSVGSGRGRTVVQLLRAADVDGDVQLLLGMPFPYTARAAQPTRALFLSEDSFEELLATHPAVARRWLSSAAARIATGQRRVMDLLGKSLPSQVARLLLAESLDGHIPLPQRTLAAMLGVHRPSLNKVLKDFEKKGLLELAYADIRVLDDEGLSRLAR
ncbi:MAG TPA: Crp/Fnr family transcriptional regulator [Actinomycetota bacterium]|nr:Crp/Fnr family transcriptional regulator [Actinomycetota bacterium]